MILYPLTKMKAILMVLVLSATLVALQGRPDGAPLAACDNLTLGHGVAPQTSESPFTINMTQFEDPSDSSQYWYTPGMIYTRKSLLTL